MRNRKSLLSGLFLFAALMAIGAGTQWQTVTFTDWQDMVAARGFRDGTIVNLKFNGMDLRYEYVAASTKAANSIANGPGTVADAVGTGNERWELRHEGSLLVNLWGANAANADNTTAIQAAFDSGDDVRGNGDDEYAIGSPIVVSRTVFTRISVSSLHLRPTGAFKAIDITNTDVPVVSTLVTPVRHGTQTITVADATGMNVGQHITVVSDATWPYDTARGTLKGETSVIESIVGNTLTMAQPVFCDYANGETVTVTARDGIEVLVEDCSIVYSTSTSTTAMSVNRAIKGKLESLRIQNASAAGLGMNTCFGVTLSNCTFEDANAGSNEGYGVQFNQSTLCSVTSSTLRNCRRGVDVSGSHPSHGITIDSNQVFGLKANVGSCLGTHNSANLTSITNNLMVGSGQSVIIRSPNTLISGNRFYAPDTTCISHAGGENILVSNNYFTIEPKFATAGQTNTVASSFYELGTIDGENSDLFANDSAMITITGNHVSGIKNQFIRIKAPLLTLRNFHVYANSVSLQSNASGGLTSFLVSDNALTTISNSFAWRNSIKPSIGTYEKFRNIYLPPLPITAQVHDISVAADGDTTPSVQDISVLRVDNSAATTIGNFDDGVEGQRLTVLIQDANTGITDGTDIEMHGNSYVAAAGNASFQFLYDGTQWQLTGREQ